MNLQIGTPNLTVEYAQPHRHQNGKLVLNVEILKSNTDLAVEDIVKLFKENTEDIIRTDNAGNTMVLGGFRQTARGYYEEKTVDNGDGTTSTVEIYKIEAECVSASEFQNQKYQARITELEVKNEELEAKNAELTSELEAQAEVLDFLVMQ